MTLNGEVGLRDCGKFQFAPSSVKSSTIHQHPGIHWYYCFWQEREQIMIQFHSRLIPTIIQWATLDAHFFLMKEHCRVCVNLSVCGAQPSPMAGLSGPLHPPCRWTWLSMQSHLLSAPWSWRKAFRAGGEFLLVAPLIGKYRFSTYPKCRLDDMKLSWPSHTGREEGGRKEKLLNVGTVTALQSRGFH